MHSIGYHCLRASIQSQRNEYEYVYAEAQSPKWFKDAIDDPSSPCKITTPLEPRGPVSYRESTHILYPVMSVRARFRCAGPQDTSLSSTTRPRSCRFYTRLYWVMVRPRFLCAAPICFVSSFIMPFDRTIVPYNYWQMTAKYLRWFCRDRGCGGTGDCWSGIIQAFYMAMCTNQTLLIS